MAACPWGPATPAPPPPPPPPRPASSPATSSSSSASPGNSSAPTRARPPPRPRPAPALPPPRFQELGAVAAGWRCVESGRAPGAPRPGAVVQAASRLAQGLASHAGRPPRPLPISVPPAAAGEWVGMGGRGVGVAARRCGAGRAQGVHGAAEPIPPASLGLHGRGRPHLRGGARQRGQGQGTGRSGAPLPGPAVPDSPGPRRRMVSRLLDCGRLLPRPATPSIGHFLGVERD